MFVILVLPINGAYGTSYEYDELGHLKRIELDNHNIIVYEYDQIGNILSKKCISNNTAATINNSDDNQNNEKNKTLLDNPSEK